MNHSSKRARMYLASLGFLLCTLVPVRSYAEMPDADAMIDYSFKGFTLGIEIGLSVGYLTTGQRYRSQEWRSLVVGMGVGAFAGITAGIFISAADYSSNRGSSVGYYILRDTNYGTLIGAAMGAVVGALFWLNDGLPRDLLRGTAYGMLFGGVAGITYGIIESRNASPRGIRRRDRDHDSYDDWRYSFVPYLDGGMVGVSKHF
jgi:MFS family permease